MQVKVVKAKRKRNPNIADVGATSRSSPNIADVGAMAVLTEKASIHRKIVRR